MDDFIRFVAERHPHLLNPPDGMISASDVRLSHQLDSEFRMDRIYAVLSQRQDPKTA